MRDDNMAVSEVQRQVEAVALAVKQGSSISDLRHHTFTGKLKGAQVGWLGGLAWWATDQLATPMAWPCLSAFSCDNLKQLGQHVVQLAAISNWMLQRHRPLREANKRLIGHSSPQADPLVR